MGVFLNDGEEAEMDIEQTHDGVQVGDDDDTENVEFLLLENEKDMKELDEIVKNNLEDIENSDPLVENTEHKQQIKEKGRGKKKKKKKKGGGKKKKKKKKKK